MRRDSSHSVEGKAEHYTTRSEKNSMELMASWSALQAEVFSSVARVIPVCRH